jgi:uncharacterized protein YggE
MKKLLVLSLVTMLALNGKAQTKTEIDERPYIEVNGNAEQEVVPDEIYIGIMLRERYVNKEKVSIEVQEEKLIAALKGIGIDMKNLSLSDANADYVKVKWKTKDVITKKDYTLKVNNASAVGQVFQELDKLDINDANVDKVSHSKIDSIKREVRIMAIKAAKAKADYLLAAIGEQTGKPIVVRETEVHYGELSALNIRGSRSSVAEYYVDGVKVDKRTEIQFQKIKVQSSIYTKFLIK